MSARNKQKKSVTKIVSTRPQGKVTTTTVVKSKAPNNQNRKPSKGGQAASVRNNLHLSPCSRDYAACLSNPFTGPLACIPDFPAIQSRRVRVFSRGNFQTGTQGVGFICVTPHFAVANNSPSCFFSGSTFAGTVVTPDSTVAGVSSSVSNSEYASTDIGTANNKIQTRVVASGLRVRYSGTELGRGGQIHAFQEPTGDSLQGNAIADFMAQDQARKFPMSSREWTTICYRPKLSGNGFVSTSPSTLAAQTAAALPSANYIAFLIQAPDTNTITMEYEFYTVFEATGRTVRGIQNSHVDIVGYSAIHTVAANGNFGRAQQIPQKAQDDNFFTEIGHYLLNGLTWVGEHAGQIASAVGTVMSML